MERLCPRASPQSFDWFRRDLGTKKTLTSYVNSPRISFTSFFKILEERKIAGVTKNDFKNIQLREDYLFKMLERRTASPVLPTAVVHMVLAHSTNAFVTALCPFSPQCDALTSTSDFLRHFRACRNVQQQGFLILPRMTEWIILRNH